ncbi:MAG: HAMP domain-containing histidine kinase [Chitinophagales bacterium]|nr:HAMP domain-containing histidine kinase [Chitinophagales bacterium]
MKLLNQSIKYIAISILPVIGLWAVFSYFNIHDKISESVDEGLENYKRQIIYRAHQDSSILLRHNFNESFFTIREIAPEIALAVTDIYTDTVMYMQDRDDDEPEAEPVRILTTAFERNNHYYELRILNSLVEEDDLISQLLWNSVWLYIILVLVIIIIHNFVLQRLWKPFYHLLQQLKNYRLGHTKNLPHTTTNIKEFIDLQQAVNTLLQHSIETYEQQKQFIGNASHELQTPLAITINKLELLLEKGNLESTQAENIAEVMQIVERLIKLNKSLLLLTKIENRQFLNNQAISVPQLAQQIVNDLEEITSYKNITIEMETSAALTIEMDAALANILIANLIRNAVFHNISNGIVSITIGTQAISICNTGNNEPLPVEKIFTRFYKSGSNTPGSGLGLAIVKAICNLYGFGVTYAFKNGKHCFEINFGK